MPNVARIDVHKDDLTDCLAQSRMKTVAGFERWLFKHAQGVTRGPALRVYTTDGTIRFYRRRSQ